MSGPSCFPEPTAHDPTPGRDGEPRWAWLARSTWERAVQTRRFYNECLAALPNEIGRRLCVQLKTDPTESTHFELVVGSFLKLLGAERIEYEVRGSEGRRVDWLAHFEGGRVSVEATAPVVNAVIGEEIKASRPIVQMVVREMPPGWSVWVAQVPRLGANEPKQRFRKQLRQLLMTVPPGEPGERVTIKDSFDDGSVELILFGADDPLAPSIVGAGPGVGYMDDTSEVIRHAVAGKRLQARGAPKPVLAAIYTAGFGRFEIDKFDIGLFGRTVQQMGTGELTFDPSGVFGGGSGEPTFAGALAFAHLGMRGGPDPILYLHPRFNGALPPALMSLRRRELRAEGILETPAQIEGLLSRLPWPVA